MVLIRRFAARVNACPHASQPTGAQSLTFVIHDSIAEAGIGGHRAPDGSARWSQALLHGRFGSGSSISSIFISGVRNRAFLGFPKWMVRLSWHTVERTMKLLGVRFDKVQTF